MNKLQRLFMKDIEERLNHNSILTEVYGTTNNLTDYLKKAKKRQRKDEL